MTVIAAAITKRDGVVMVADTQITDGWEKNLNDANKLCAVGENDAWIIGFCGYVRDAQVIRYFTEWPIWNPAEADATKFFVTQVVPAIRGAVDGQGIILKDRDRREHIGSSFILARDGLVVTVDIDLSVTVSTVGRAAVGSGFAEALGYLGDAGPWTKGDVIEAARRATLTADGVGGNLHVISTKKPVVEVVEL